MTKSMKFLTVAGALGAALLCGGAAKAQGYYDRDYDRTPSETVIVHPYYDEIQQRQLLGHVDGEINPTEVSISHPVSYSDLDLSRDSDYLELLHRVRGTARDLCAALDDRYPDLRDRDGDRQCVRQAVHNAMLQVSDPAG